MGHDAMASHFSILYSECGLEKRERHLSQARELMEMEEALYEDPEGRLALRIQLGVMGCISLG